jgi:hypothetical protein
MSLLSWAAPIIGSFFGPAGLAVGAAVSAADSARESDKLAGRFGDISKRGGPTTEAMSKEMSEWARKDWDRFKANYRPVAEGLARDAALPPDYAKAEGLASADVAQQAGGVNDTTTALGIRRGINPGSGNARVAARDVTAATGAAEGEGLGLARRGEDTRVFKKRMNVLKSNKNIPVMSNVMGGKVMDLATLGARRNAGLSETFAGAAGEGLFDAGRNLAGADWGNTSWNRTDPDAVNDAYHPGYNEGGLIRGPGTGRSDSIPAEIDDNVPARVSNGEYELPEFVVRYFGKKYLDELNARYGDEPRDAEMGAP